MVESSMAAVPEGSSEVGLILRLANLEFTPKTLLQSLQYVMDLDLQYAALQQTWAQEILAMESSVFQIAPFS